MCAELLKTDNHAECCKKKAPCGSPYGTTGLSKSTVRKYHATLSSALWAAVKAKAGINNAATMDAYQPSAKAAKAGSKKFQTWNKHEVRDLLEATKDDDFHPIWLTLASLS